MDVLLTDDLSLDDPWMDVLPPVVLLMAVLSLADLSMGVLRRVCPSRVVATWLVCLLVLRFAAFAERSTASRNRPWLRVVV